MKKNNNKGFMLTELLVTSTLICTVLIFLYSQFYNIKRGYDVSFKYNTVNDLYAASNVKTFLLDNGINQIKNNLDSEVLYVDIKNDYSEIKSPTFWLTLLSSLNINDILFTHADLTDLIANINDIDIDEGMKQFIKHIDFDKDSTDYRIIISFNDNTYASILMGDE